MLNFESDYIQGAHPLLLKRLVDTNMEPLSGYGCDEYAETAKAKIRKACKCPKAQISFISGGTQTNQLVIDAILKPWEGVISPVTGHINTHEASAIEFTGHKVMPIPAIEGKINAEDLKKYLKTFYNDGNKEHMTWPGLVYITFPTEYGTLYTKKELSDIATVCHSFNIPLFADGARLAYALAAKENDVSLSDLAKYCDVFYIGGTKCGALCGEAVVFTKDNEPEHFVNLTKKHGALLEKGRLLSIQFDELFTNNLYLTAGENAIKMAEILKTGFKEAGYKFLLNSPTNQIFVILENKQMKNLATKVKFSFWETVDENHTAVRFATSWATKQKDVDELLSII